MAAQYIATQPILDLCNNTVWRAGAWVARRFWERGGLDLVGAREMVAAAADG